jgi:hypothetical protein
MGCDSYPPDSTKRDIEFIDPTGIGHDALNKAPYKYMRGISLSVPARQWFDIEAHDFLALAIQSA